MIRKEILLPANRSEVWSALTDPKELERWFANDVELDLRPGGAATFRWGNGEWRHATTGGCPREAGGRDSPFALAQNQAVTPPEQPVEKGVWKSLSFPPCRRSLPLPPNSQAGRQTEAL